MKNIVTFLALAGVLICGPRWVAAEDINRTDADEVTWQIKGSSDIGLAISSQGIVYNTEGLINVHEDFPFIVTPSTFEILGIAVSTKDLSSAPTTYPNPNQAISQPRYPGPLIFQQYFYVGRSTHNFTSTVTVSGYDSTGSSRTLKLVLSTAPVSTGFAYVYISSIVFSIFATTQPIDNVLSYISIGSTYTVGLANDIRGTDDVYATWENSVVQSSRTIDATYNTWTPNAVPNYSLALSTTLAGNTAGGAGTNIRALGNVYGISYRAKQSPPRRLAPNRLLYLP